MNTVEYSVVVPIYNSENSIEILHKELCIFFQNKYSFEIIYVNDYSIDNSWDILKKIKNSSDNTLIINFNKNYGQHAATICGFKYAKGKYVITIDDDLEVHPSKIQQLIDFQKTTHSDLTYGVYPKLNQSKTRKILTSIYKLLSKLEGSKKGKGSSFRLLTNSLTKKISENHKQFIFVDELCLWYTSKIDFVNVEPNINYINKKRYSFFNLFSITSNLILFTSTFSLKLVTTIGISLSVINFIIGLFFIHRKLILKTHVDGFTTIIVSILFSTGLIIFSIGIIALYLSKILKSINNLPSYNESEVI